SVGTGTSPGENSSLKPKELNLLFNATTIPSALMYAALNEQDLLCRVFGDCVAGHILNREVDTMSPSLGPLREKLFCHIRYNAEWTKVSERSAAVMSTRRPAKSSTRSMPFRRLSASEKRPLSGRLTIPTSTSKPSGLIAAVGGHTPVEDACSKIDQ